MGFSAMTQTGLHLRFTVFWSAGSDNVSDVRLCVETTVTVELLAQPPLTAVALSLAAEDGKPLCTPPGCRLMAVQTAQS